MEKNQFAMAFIDTWYEKRSKNPELVEARAYYRGLANQMKKVVNSGATSLDLEQIKRAGPGAYKNEYGKLECSNNSFRFIFGMAITALKRQQVEEKKQQRKSENGGLSILSRMGWFRFPRNDGRNK